MNPEPHVAIVSTTPAALRADMNRVGWRLNSARGNDMCASQLNLEFNDAVRDAFLAMDGGSSQGEATSVAHRSKLDVWTKEVLQAAYKAPSPRM